MKFFRQSQIEQQATTLYNQATQNILELKDPVNKQQLEKNLSLYQQSLKIQEHRDTRWNYEKVTEFLWKKTETSGEESKKSSNKSQEKDKNNQWDAWQQKAWNQKSSDPSSTNPQSSSWASGSELWEQGTWNTQLSESEKSKLQDYQQQLQNIQQQMSKDFNTQQDDKNLDDGFGSSLFQQFFGGKNPFEEELPRQDPNTKDW